MGVFVLQQFFPNTWTRFEELRALEGVENRVTFGFSNSVPLIEENPVLGVGNGASVMAYGREWAGSKQLLLPAHNTYVYIWSELGVIGVFLFITALLSLLRLLHPRNGQPILILGLALGCTMIVMGFDYYFWGEPRSQVLLFWLAGMMWGYVARPGQQDDEAWTEKPDYYPPSRKYLLAKKLHLFRKDMEQFSGLSSNATVTVQIVTLNNAGTIDTCLDSVEQQTYGQVNIIVIDNGSTDDTVARVKQRGIEVHQNADNVGYSTGHNQALAASNSKYVLTLNPDAWIAPDFIGTLVEYLDAHPVVGLASGLLLRVDRLGDVPETVDSAGLMMQRSGRQRLRYEGLGAENAPQDVSPIFGPDGAAAFYRRKMLHDITIEGEVFDEDFFLHKEDVDLCWRAQLLGWDAACVPDAVAHHIRTFRPGQRQKVQQALRFWAVRNRYLKLIKNADLSNILNDLPFLLGYEALIIAYLLLRERQSLPAYAAAWRATRHMFRKRKLIQARRRRSAEQIRRIMQASKPL